MWSKQRFLALACVASGTCTAAAGAREPSTPSERGTQRVGVAQRGCTDGERRHHVDLRRSVRPCRPTERRPAPAATGSPFWIYEANGPALVLGAQLASGPDRNGLGLHAGAAYRFPSRLEVGAGVQLLWLTPTDWELIDIDFGASAYPDRERSERSLLPRLHASAGLGEGGRFYAFGAYGPTRVRVVGGHPALPRIDRDVWSYAFGVGLSYYLLDIGAQVLGFRQHIAESHELADDLTTAIPGGAGGPELLISVGLVVPIPLLARGAL